MILDLRLNLRVKKRSEPLKHVLAFLLFLEKLNVVVVCQALLLLSRLTANRFQPRVAAVHTMQAIDKFLAMLIFKRVRLLRLLYPRKPRLRPRVKVRDGPVRERRRLVDLRLLVVARIRNRKDIVSQMRLRLLRQAQAFGFEAGYNALARFYLLHAVLPSGRLDARARPVERAHRLYADLGGGRGAARHERAGASAYPPLLAGLGLESFTQ